MKPQRTLAALVAVALLATACGRGGSGGEEEAPAASAAAADFGDLKGVCGPGKPAGSPAQGVTATEINVGVFTDQGFDKRPDYTTAAKVFTSWCNEAGGVNGRRVVANTRDSRLMEVRQRMLESCREDFFIVGGASALDGMGVRDRLNCLLPEFPATTTQAENNGSDLQISQWGGSSYSRYTGYFTWLLKEAYPGSAKAVGSLVGDSPVTKVLAEQVKETLEGVGGRFAYSDLYPVSGLADWTPYAQAIKSRNVRGLVFYGNLTELAKLELALTNIGYRLDWIDANAYSYGPAFLKLAGRAIGFQNNLADLGGIHPLENAAANPATRRLIDLFEKYAPGAQVTLGTIRSFSAFLLFAKAAAACGNDLTRRCVFEAGRRETAWTAGGLQAPVDLSKPDAPLDCFNVERATPQGWRPADFRPNKGAFRCGAPAYRLTRSYIKPVTLADVGKTMADLK
ncbi:ABC-type branched-chain amino acid transport system, substrate-binding protein [Thermomonospora echinospora]|uniref:ABC-type branched-chain amino acid transport system, substrate-binding protein n=1 Tax=Thermomonospora echinospora TaxID=1992 RepID=A0A1H6DG83_9ACTN|nr:ABC transporter substrate-binding protein [Thermomonospora echinospora]SEG83695.1 ABC-type branched-chain amino acid transport system, substrate-binding protein [Thermomonospora echinospora]